MRSYLIALAACAPVRQSPAPAERAAVLGEAFAIDSKVLGERRTINVYLPPGYASATDRYPVLYMPDGGMAEDFPHVAGDVDVSIKNAVIRPVIVVGIENTERRRDLLAATTRADEREIAPHAGGSDRFRRFLRDELKPRIAARYRTTTESALVGESFAGLFVVETLLVEPTLFDGYIAADPSLWWNDEELVAHANPRLVGWTAGPKRLYVAASSDAPLDAIDALFTALRINAPAGVTWTYEPMPAERHATIFPTAALHGVRTVFAP